MSLLQTMIDRLNAAVDEHNAGIDAAVENCELTANQAAAWKLPPGIVTVDLVKAGPEKWPKVLLRAVQSVIVNEAPAEVVRMADSSPVQTETIKHLRLGAQRSIGNMPGPLFGLPVGVHLADMAHLIAHCGAEKAILLG